LVKVLKGDRGIRKAVLVALGLSVAAALPMMTSISAQSPSRAATCITKEEVDTVSKQPGVDRTIRVIDIGPEHFSVGRDAFRSLSRASNRGLSHHLG
jgi:hypothetical protein